MNQKIRAIITGSTGMVGEGVLIECLAHPVVEKVLVVNRKTCGYTHPKLKEILHADFFNLAPIENQLSDYNACFFCLGVSSVGMKEDEYKHLTYDLTLGFANVLAAKNPNMVFTYISGAGTDSSENGRMMWARVKGKTENDLMKLPFKAAYAFRPGAMQPTKGQKYALKYYKYFNWMIPTLRKLFPTYVHTLQELALAMINSVKFGYEKPVLEVPDLVRLAKQQAD